MVDDDVVAVESIFSKEGAVSKSAGGIVTLIVLQRVDTMMRFYEALLVVPKNSGLYKRSLARCKASVNSLFRLLRPRMSKLSKKDKYEYDVKKFEDFLKDDKVGEAVDFLLSYLELDLELTKLDTRAKFDRTNIVKSNKAQGYTG